jgi:hypothetical protein
MNDNYKAMFGGFAMCAVVTMIPILKVVVGIVGAYIVGFILVEKLQNAFDKEKTTV